MKSISLIALTVVSALSDCSPFNPAGLGDGLFARIRTNKGDIIIRLYFKQTPVTVANFVTLAEGKNPFVADSLKGKPYYNDVIFHRVIKDFMIQGGDRTSTGSGSPGYKFEDEFVDSLTHNKPGIISMANSGPNTNGSQFFITHKPTPHLNGKHSVFGEVVQGMETVDVIASVETSKNPATKDRPVQDVVIKAVEIVRNGKAAKKFNANSVMKNYFEKINQREAAIKKVAEAAAVEFKLQQEKAEALPSGLKVLFLHKAGKEKPQTGQTVKVYYAGYLTDGILFDSNWIEVAEKYQQVNPMRKQQNGYAPIPMQYSPQARLIPGFKEGLQLMSVGDKVRLFIPSALGYGPTGSGGIIPPNANLVFDIELVEIAM